MNRLVDPTQADRIRAEIARDYGAHTIRSGAQVPPIRRLPVRSLAMNYVLGGGYAFNRMTRLWGAFSSGKSTAMLDAFYCAQNYGGLRLQQLEREARWAEADGDDRYAKILRRLGAEEAERYGDGLRCFYIDNEGSFDENQARALGVKLDSDSFEIVQTGRIEVIGDIGQKALRAYHVVAVDSTTDTISLDELGHKDGIHGKLPMIRAQRWQDNMLWWSDRMSSDNLLIFSSQARQRSGRSTSFAQQVGEKAPGGEALNHKPSTILHFMKGGWLKRKAGGGFEPIGEKGGERNAFGRTQPAGGELVIQCEKNKTGVALRTALLHFDRATSFFDPLHELEKLGKYFRVLEPRRSWVDTPDAGKVNGVRRALEESPALVRQIEDVVFRCAADPLHEQLVLRRVGGPGEDLAPDMEEPT